MSKSEILFNRALLWIVLMHLTDSKVASVMFSICALLNLIDSVIRMVSEETK